MVVHANRNRCIIVLCDHISLSTFPERMARVKSIVQHLGTLCSEVVHALAVHALQPKHLSE